MTPLKLLEKAVPQLEQLPGAFAVAGGLAASFYRNQPRVTNDVDIALCLESVEATEAAATKIIENLGLYSAVGWIAEAGERLSKSTPLIIGRVSKDNLESTIDFMLPAFPWLPQAVVRAQDNIIDYGFARLATVAPEDMIIAKTFALAIEPNRFMDMDDIKSIFSADNRLDVPYIVNEFERHDISLPKQLRSFAPDALKRQERRKAL